MHVGLLSGQVFSPLVKIGSRGVTGAAALLPDEPHIIPTLTERWSAWNVPLSSMLTTVDGHWKMLAVALLKAVWWDFYPTIRQYEGYLVYCVFVCFFCLFFARLRISQRGKELWTWNFACVLAYYPDRSFPLRWRLVRGESRGRRHYFRDEHPFQLMFGWEMHPELGQRHRLRPYCGICILQACWRTCFHFC